MGGEEEGRRREGEEGDTTSAARRGRLLRGERRGGGGVSVGSRFSRSSSRSFGLDDNNNKNNTARGEEDDHHHRISIVKMGARGAPFGRRRNDADAKKEDPHAYSERDETPLEEAGDGMVDGARAPVPITEEEDEQSDRSSRKS